MTVRTTKQHVHFAHPWFLEDPAELFPPGTYEVETDEELLDGLSFTAYRRIVSVIRMPRAGGLAGASDALMTRPNQLDAALARDEAAARPSS